MDANREKKQNGDGPTYGFQVTKPRSQSHAGSVWENHYESQKAAEAAEAEKKREEQQEKQLESAKGIKQAAIEKIKSSNAAVVKTEVDSETKEALSDASKWARMQLEERRKKLAERGIAAPQPAPKRRASSAATLMEQRKLAMKEAEQEAEKRAIERKKAEIAALSLKAKIEADELAAKQKKEREEKEEKEREEKEKEKEEAEFEVERKESSEVEVEMMQPEVPTQEAPSDAKVATPCKDDAKDGGSSDTDGDFEDANDTEALDSEAEENSRDSSRTLFGSTVSGFDNRSSAGTVYGSVSSDMRSNAGSVYVSAVEAPGAADETEDEVSSAPLQEKSTSVGQEKRSSVVQQPPPMEEEMDDSPSDEEEEPAPEMPAPRAPSNAGLSTPQPSDAVSRPQPSDAAVSTPQPKLSNGTPSQPAPGSLSPTALRKKESGRSGWLHKKGGSKVDNGKHKPFTRRNWKLRYFVLDGGSGELQYYANKGDPAPLGVLYLGKCTCAEIRHRNKPYVLSFKAADRDNFLISAESHEDLHDWAIHMALHCPEGVSNHDIPDLSKLEETGSP